MRALAAAALTLMLGWLGITLLLSVLEPWLITLAREQQAHQAIPQTATSAAALVFVFGAGQVALLVGACVMAFGFRMPRAAVAAGGRRASDAAPSAQAMAAAETVSSRAQRLAFDLQREPTISASRARPMEIAAATTAAGRRDIHTVQTTRLGDDYRRPAVATRRLKAR